MTQNAALQEFENELRELLTKVRATLNENDGKQVNSQPLQGQWTINECFAHLNAEYDYFLPKIELAIHKSKARRWNQQGERESNWFGRRAITRVHPENPRPRKCAKRVNPVRLNIRQNEMKAFLINGEMLLRFMRHAEDVDLNRTKVKNYRWPGFKFRLGDLFEYLILHAKRHLK